MLLGPGTDLSAIYSFSWGLSSYSEVTCDISAFIERSEQLLVAQEKK